MAGERTAGVASFVPSFAERHVFSVTGRTFSWNDVVSVAEVRGDLQEPTRVAAEGLACMRRLSVNGEEIDAGALERAEEDFRRARRLLSGQETVEWLAAKLITVSDWREVIRRSLLR